MRWQRAPGVRLEALGESWAAFSALSGETLLIGNESAAVLEVLAEGACTAAELCAVLAQDSGLPPAQIAALLEESRPALVAAGLVRVAASPPGRPEGETRSAQHEGRPVGAGRSAKAPE